MPYAIAKDGLKLHYNFLNPQSKKPLLVFAHGWVMNWTCFKQEIKYFKARGYPILYFDFRGHGKSEVPDKHESFTLDTMADDIFSLLETLKIKRKVSLIGHSLGGLISLIFSIKYKSKLSNLILLDASYTYPDNLPLVKHFSKNHLLKHIYHHLAKSNKNKVQKLFDEDMYLKNHKMIPAHFLLSNIMHANLKTIFLLLDEIFHLNMIRKLSSIKTRTLIIGSEKDELFSEKTTKSIHKHIPNSQLIIIEGRHDVIMKKPLEVSDLIEKFVCRGRNNG